MDSDDEIFLTQNTFSQEPFSPELNLEELVGDFREVSERDSVALEKKENQYTVNNNTTYFMNHTFSFVIQHPLFNLHTS